MCHVFHHFIQHYNKSFGCEKTNAACFFRLLLNGGSRLSACEILKFVHVKLFVMRSAMRFATLNCKYMTTKSLEDLGGVLASQPRLPTNHALSGFLGHPYAFQLFAVVVGLLVAFKTQSAYSRYWEAEDRVDE